ncbi:MAG: coenzyme synthetase [Planctomycetes bacterium]|nr:coenzyme synthetase [Planctomycetota bacterium]
MSSPVAAPARLRHDYDYLAALTPGVLNSARLLAELMPADETQARAALAPRLDILRGQMLASPFWLRRMIDHGLAPRDLRTLDDLLHFPATSRADLRDFGPEMPELDPSSEAARQSVLVKSSGSSGEPVGVFKDLADCVHMWAVLRFWLGALGLALPDQPRVTLLCALPGGLEYESRLPTLNNGWLVRISTVRQNPLARLIASDPQVLFTDPAGLHWLAGQAQAPRPKLILTSAQHCPEDLRQLLAQRTGAIVLDYYSTTETGAIAWRCPRDPSQWHVLTPEIWVEQVQQELVVTRLRQSLLPIVRYRTGDAGRVCFGRCQCGRTGWSITDFTGRRACWFSAPNGGKADAWQLAWLFKYHNLSDFRLTQQGAQSFQLELAGDCTELSALLAKLQGALRNMGWPEPQIDAIRVARIDQRGDKPEPFRCTRAPAP